MPDQETTLRQRAKAVRPYRCKNLIAVIENPMDVKNIGTILRNVNAFGIVLYEITKQRRTYQEKYKRAIRNPGTATQGAA